MKTRLVITFACGILSVAGCTPQVRPANLDDFPGTEHMAKGPGLFSSQLGVSDSSGTVIYSSEAKASSAKVGGGSVKAPETNTRRVQAGEDEHYHEFEAFKAYQQFLKLPADAPERKQFRQWLEWKRYQQWKAHQ